MNAAIDLGIGSEIDPARYGFDSAAHVSGGYPDGTVDVDQCAAHLGAVSETQLAVHRVNLAAHARLPRKLDRAVDGLERGGTRLRPQRNAAVHGLRAAHDRALADTDRAAHGRDIPAVLAGCHLDAAHHFGGFRGARGVTCRAHAEDHPCRNQTPTPRPEQHALPSCVALKWSSSGNLKENRAMAAKRKGPRAPQ